MQELRFTVSPDGKLRSTTIGIVLIMIFALLIVLAITYVKEGTDRGFYTTTLLIIALYSATVFFSWAYSPRAYLLTGNSVVIERPAKDIVIPYSSIHSVEKRNSLGNRMRRQMGNGGLFSFSGTFRNKELGKVKMYVKNKNYVIIDAGERYILSPDEREEFILMLKASL